MLSMIALLAAHLEKTAPVISTGFILEDPAHDEANPANPEKKADKKLMLVVL